MNKVAFNRIKTLIDNLDVFTAVTTNIPTPFDFSNEVIPSTGAAGSIGSGLTLQVLTSRFKALSRSNY